jgi:hypothetical protein
MGFWTSKFLYTLKEDISILNLETNTHQIMKIYYGMILNCLIILQEHTNTSNKCDSEHQNSLYIIHSSSVLRVLTLIVETDTTKSRVMISQLFYISSHN